MRAVFMCFSRPYGTPCQSGPYPPRKWRPTFNRLLTGDGLSHVIIQPDTSGRVRLSLTADY